ncbi:MAG TPA: hypothetical protein VFD58_33095 [Blastocatellia bacterium]|nr:hypothetical protein [Blastocatellia bacterium]
MNPGIVRFLGIISLLTGVVLSYLNFNPTVVTVLYVLALLLIVTGIILRLMGSRRTRTGKTP